MEFHLATPSGDIYLFSSDEGRAFLSSWVETMGGHAVKAPYEIQGPTDKAALQEIQDRTTDPDMKAQLN